jgi:hypothetical protein
MNVAFVGIQNRAMDAIERSALVELFERWTPEKLLTLDEWGTAETAHRLAVQCGVEVFKYPTNNPRARSNYQKGSSYAFAHDPAGSYEQMWGEMMSVADALVVDGADEDVGEWPEVRMAEAKGIDVWTVWGGVVRKLEIARG